MAGGQPFNESREWVDMNPQSYFALSTNKRGKGISLDIQAGHFFEDILPSFLQQQQPNNQITTNIIIHKYGYEIYEH